MAHQVRVCLHVHHRVRVHQIYIVWMVTNCLMDRMDSEPNLSIKQPISIGTMLNFDGDRHGDGDDGGTCKQALTLYKFQLGLYLPFWHTDHD